MAEAMEGKVVANNLFKQYGFDFLADKEGWRVSIEERNGEFMGFVATAGTEIHIFSISHRLITKANISKYIEPILKEYGFVTTRVPINVIDHKLRFKLGFEKTWEDAQFSYWILTSLPFKRK